jgi:2'-5' RNA ligase
MTQDDEYAIIYLLPEPALSYYLDLAQRVEDQFHLSGQRPMKAPPHITLKYPFPAEDIYLLERVLERFAAAAPRAPWSIRGFNHFITPGDFVLFLEVVPSPAVRAVHAELLERLRPLPAMRWDTYDGPDLHYHATIAHGGLTAANFPEVWAFLNAQPPPDFDLHFDHLTLLKINPDIHTVVRAYPFGG